MRSEDKEILKLVGMDSEQAGLSGYFLPFTPGCITFPYLKAEFYE